MRACLGVRQGSAAAETGGPAQFLMSVYLAPPCAQTLILPQYDFETTTSRYFAVGGARNRVSHKTLSQLSTEIIAVLSLQCCVIIPQPQRPIGSHPLLLPFHTFSQIAPGASISF